MRVAVIGLGYWGTNWVRTLKESPDIEQVVGLDPSDQARAALVQRHSDIRVIESLNDLLSDPALKAVILATPASTHFSLARRCLLAGKHVLVEKPATTRWDEARMLDRIAQDQALVFMVGHTALFTPEFEAVRALADRGELGRLLYFEAYYGNVGQVRSDTNVLWDLAPHPLAMFASLFPEPVIDVMTWGLAQPSRCLDTCHILLRTASGASGHAWVSWRYPVKTRRWVVGGTDRTVVVDEVSPNQRVQAFELDPQTGRSARLSMQSPSRPPSQPLARELQCFLEAIRSEAGRATDAMSWLPTMELLTRAESSLGGMDHVD